MSIGRLICFPWPKATSLSSTLQPIIMHSASNGNVAAFNGGSQIHPRSDRGRGH